MLYFIVREFLNLNFSGWIVSYTLLLFICL